MGGHKIVCVSLNNMEDKDISMTTTENNAISWPSTLNAGVDLFFKTVRGVDRDALRTLLRAAWAESPEVTLRIIFQTRDCRGGKGEKLIFYQAIEWLQSVQPNTVRKNLNLVPFFGTWKDILQLCVHVPELQDVLIEQVANQLRQDRDATLASKDAKVSLCAKWAPSEKHAFDKKHKLAQKLAQVLYPCKKNALALYRKEYLVPLRNQLRVTEVYMCANDWGHIPYPSVPSRCMHRSKKSFAQHDEDRFQQYLRDAIAGKAKMQGKQMYPHELVKSVRSSRGEDLVAEVQWKVILDDLKQQGSLSKSVALSDVSSSMNGTPMEVSIALGLLLSELCDGPFHNMVITFETTPRFHNVEGNSFQERVRNLANAPWGGSTNFQAAMDLILQMAKDENVPQSEMPDKLFVFSDMQFNQADNNYQTNHQNVVSKFKAAGYEVPLLVYWNVRANTVDFPALADTPGVALLAGYSPSLMKVVMDGCELGVEMPEEGETATLQKKELNPIDILKKAICDERYDALCL